MTNIWQVCRLQKWHFSRGIVTFFCHFGAIFSKMCKHIKNYSEYSRKMTKNAKKTCNFAGCQNGIFSRQCHFSVISVQFAQTYAKHQKLFEKLRKNDKNDNTWRKITFLQPAKLSFFCLFLWGHVVEFLSFFCHFGAVFQKY
jgi:hypothetical protein